MTAEQLINDQMVWSLLMVTGVLSALVVGGLVSAVIHWVYTRWRDR